MGVRDGDCFGLPFDTHIEEQGLHNHCEYVLPCDSVARAAEDASLHIPGFENIKAMHAKLLDYNTHGSDGTNDSDEEAEEDVEEDGDFNPDHSEDEAEESDSLRVRQQAKRTMLDRIDRIDGIVPGCKPKAAMVPRAPRALRATRASATGIAWSSAPAKAAPWRTDNKASQGSKSSKAEPKASNKGKANKGKDKDKGKPGNSGKVKGKHSKHGKGKGKDTHPKPKGRR